MAAAGAYIKCTFGGGKPLNELASLIQKRAALMKSQYTEGAVRSTAMNVLTSLRAATAVASKKNPSIIDSRWKVDIHPANYIGGWARGKRVIRDESGSHSMRIGPNGNRVINLAGDYARCKTGQVYSLAITELPASRPFYEVLVLARSAEDLKDFAERRIRRRIGQYSGISRRVLGIALKRIGSKTSTEGSSGELGRLAEPMANVKTAKTGVGSGSFSVGVISELPYSLYAIKGGESGVDAALKKAANRTAAVINRFAAKNFEEKVDIPFPEVSSAR